MIRAALIPLFVKQIKSSRNMQLIQPKVKELQKKYGHDRERLAQETMKLYKETGTNPFASCLPILLQMPIFFALFRLLDQAAHDKGHGFLTTELAKDFGNAELFGSIPISATFLKADGQVGVQIFAAVLVVAMTATTFLTQRQLMSKNMPADALTGPYAQQQKMLLYVLPVVFAVGGIAFPIGVLLYWTTSNLWTMGQQFYVIRNNPAPGTAAETAKIEPRPGEGRQARRPDTGMLPWRRKPLRWSRTSSTQRPQQRQQPKKQSRSQRKKSRQEADPRVRRAEANARTDRALRRPEPVTDQTRDPRGRRRPIVERPSGPERRARRRESARRPPGDRRPRERLEHEGDIAADYLEELLDIADLDGDLDMDVEGDRAAVSIVGRRRPRPAGRARRRGARGPAGADPAGGLPRDRRALPADARHRRSPGRTAAPSWPSWPRIGRAR